MQTSPPPGRCQAGGLFEYCGNENRVVRSVKGINFISALYHVDEISLPVGYHLVEKIEFYIDKKTSEEKRRSPVTKMKSTGQSGTETGYPHDYLSGGS